MKTSELKDDSLDWAVAKCEGITPIAVKKNYSKGYILYSIPASTVPLEYSSKWAQGGPIIDREKISVLEAGDFWGARPLQDGVTPTRDSYGPTPLIAAMRCYVASKMGEDVSIPEELAK